MKKAIIIDNIFWHLQHQEFFIDSIFYRTGLSGKIGKWYRLKENEDDILCMSFGENQIKIIDEDKF